MIRLALSGSLAAIVCLSVPVTGRNPDGPSPGERAYQRCYACHALSSDTIGADGPHLGGIVGRRVASVPGYRYSAAITAYAKDKPVWTRERLDAFLADPEGTVPGNAMGFFGMGDQKERAALIAWLERQP